MGNGASPAIIGGDHYFNFPSIGLSWLTVKVRVWVAMLHTDQTVGSSVMNARVVTVSGVTWTSFTSSPTFGCGGWEGVGSLSTGSPCGGGSGTSTSA